VREWTESALDGVHSGQIEDRGIRGGGWFDTEDLRLRFSLRDLSAPGSNFVGFRVASVPEPSSTVLMLSAGLLALARRRRRRAQA